MFLLGWHGLAQPRPCEFCSLGERDKGDGECASAAALGLLREGMWNRRERHRVGPWAAVLGALPDSSTAAGVPSILWAVHGRQAPLLPVTTPRLPLDPSSSEGSSSPC